MPARLDVQQRRSSAKHSTPFFSEGGGGSTTDYIAHWSSILSSFHQSDKLAGKNWCAQCLTHSTVRRTNRHLSNRWLSWGKFQSSTDNQYSVCMFMGRMIDKLQKKSRWCVHSWAPNFILKRKKYVTALFSLLYLIITLLVFLTVIVHQERSRPKLFFIFCCCCCCIVASFFLFLFFLFFFFFLAAVCVPEYHWFWPFSCCGNSHSFCCSSTIWGVWIACW